MRGILPRERQQEIESLLPRAVDRLEKAYPSWAAPFLGSEAKTETALRELWDGWHLLCESNLALIESEACWLWYSEFRSPQNETLGRFFCVYFLEDAALRLGASAEHMLLALKAHMGLKFPKRGSRSSTLTRLIGALEVQNPHARPLRWLRFLERDEDWQKCADYRNKWTHNLRPAIAGLGTIMTTMGLDLTEKSAGFGFGTKQPVDWTIEELRPVFRKGYARLLSVYLKIIMLMSPDGRALRKVEPVLAPKSR